MKDIKIIPNEIIFPQICEILAEGSCVKIQVKGNSMFPFFKDGQPFTIHPIKYECIKTGNVVLAKNTVSKNFVIHRIVKINDDTITLMGDGNIKGTETMSRNHVFGYIYCSKWQLKKAALWHYLLPIRRYLLIICRILIKGWFRVKDK